MLDVISVIATFAPELASTLKEYRANKPQDQQTLLLAMLVNEMDGTQKALKRLGEVERLNGDKLQVLIDRNNGS